MADGARRRDRTHWPVRKLALGAQPREDLSLSTTAEERLAMMWMLAVDAWALSGQALPDYPRRDTPVRVVRLRPGEGTVPA